jgi:hypothetical protein
VFGWVCDRAVVRFAAATVFAVLMGWLAGPLNDEGSLPEAWSCAEIPNVFFGSGKFVASWRRRWELGGGWREDDP